jgi:hypothetical protein
MFRSYMGHHQVQYLNKTGVIYSFLQLLNCCCGLTSAVRLHSDHKHSLNATRFASSHATQKHFPNIFRLALETRPTSQILVHLKAK